MNTYMATYREQQTEVFAKTSRDALNQAIGIFKLRRGSPESSEITVAIGQPTPEVA